MLWFWRTTPRQLKTSKKVWSKIGLHMIHFSTTILFRYHWWGLWPFLWNMARIWSRWHPIHWLQSFVRILRCFRGSTTGTSLLVAAACHMIYIAHCPWTEYFLDFTTKQVQDNPHGYSNSPLDWPREWRNPWGQSVLLGHSWCFDSGFLCEKRKSNRGASQCWGDQGHNICGQTRIRKNKQFIMETKGGILRVAHSKGLESS